MTSPFEPKLIRDLVPEIIREDGEEPVVHRIVSDYEWREAIRAKLCEELDEYLTDENPKELADLIEVVYLAAGRLHGIAADDLDALVAAKRQARGGFKQGYLWSGNRPSKAS